VNFPLYILLRDLLVCVIICPCDKWLSQQERCEWDHEINLTEEAPKELNVKAYVMILKEKEALNQ